MQFESPLSFKYVPPLETYQQSLVPYSLAKIPSCLRYANLSGVMSLTDAHLPIKSGFYLWPDERRRINLPGQPHGNSKFFLQHLYGEFNAFLAIVLYRYQHVSSEVGVLSSMSYRKTPDGYSANEHMVRTEGDCLEYVRALTHPSIHCNLDFPLGQRCADTKSVKRGGNTIELSPAVVGNNNAIQVVVNSHLNILGSVYWRVISEEQH